MASEHTSESLAAWECRLLRGIAADAAAEPSEDDDSVPRYWRDDSGSECSWSSRPSCYDRLDWSTSSQEDWNDGYWDDCRPGVTTAAPKRPLIQTKITSYFPKAEDGRATKVKPKGGANGGSMCGDSYLQTKLTQYYPTAHPLSASSSPPRNGLDEITTKRTPDDGFRVREAERDQETYCPAPSHWSHLLNECRRPVQLFVLRNDEAPPAADEPDPPPLKSIDWGIIAPTYYQSWGSVAWFTWLRSFIVSMLRRKGLPWGCGGIWV